jgi:hypothetical protein
MTMAQSNSVQREPSMEEILASIRRIIEDSDTVRPSGEQQDSPGMPVSRLNSADIRDFDAFRAGIQAPVDTAAEEDTGPRGEAESSEEPTSPTASSFHAIMDELRPSFTSEELRSRDRATEAEGTTAAEHGQPAEDYGLTQSAVALEADADTSADYDEAMLGFQDLLDSELKQMPEFSGAKSAPSIVSDRTGRQVAAAFGELSEAFAATRQKSFDEMAEAMIRPMLSEWLDNNLPTLVERLVREEIERIARGPAA